MALVGIVQVGLLEDEGHAQDAFPKVNRGLPVGPNQRDMVDPMGLYFLHVYSLLSSLAIKHNSDFGKV
jgi:hypothetical protein